MLSKTQIERFFVRLDIPIDKEKSLTESEITKLILTACESGVSFVAFLKVAVLNPDLNGTNAYFSSFDELYEMYCIFMTGYMTHKNLSNN